LIGVLVFAGSRGINKPKKTQGLPAGSRGKLEKETGFLKNKEGGLFQELDSQSRDLNLSRDPFSSLPATAEKISGRGGLILSGIIWDKDKPSAIINNSIVELGDTVSGNIVVDIRQDRVILNDGSNTFELKLGR